MPTSFKKDPDAVLEYAVDWSAWLGEDTIESSDWTDVTTGITVDSESFTDTTATVWLSGGTAGTRYTLTNHIVTVGGRTDDRTIAVTVQER